MAASAKNRLNDLMPSVNEWRWCLYDAANSAFSLIVMTTLFPIFFARFVMPPEAPAGAATAGLGFANAAAGLAAAVAAPYLGALADRRGFRKTGLFVALPVGCLSTLLLNAVAPGMSTAALALYCVAVFSFISGNVFYDSMLIDVTAPRRMDYISGVGFAVGYIGSVIPFVGILALMLKQGESAGSFHAGFIATAAWWALFSLPLLGLKLPKPAKADRVEPLPKRTGTLSTLSRIWKDRDTRNFLCAYFLYIDGVDTIIVMAVPYGAEIGLGAKELVAVILSIQLVAFPCSLIYGVLAPRFGTKTLLRFGICCYGFTVVAAAFLPVLESRGGKLALFLLLALTVAANQGGIQALSRSFYGRLIPPEHAAEYFGFYNIFGKFAAVLGPLLVGLSGWLLGGAQYGILGLLILFAAGAYMLGKVRSI